MSQFKLVEIKSESGKDYFIEGYVSTIDPDFVNDIVDNLGQEATYKEILNSDITMDEDHDEWRDPQTGKLYDGKKNKYPIAKVIETKLDSKGTWVKAKLNKFHPDFYERILPMVKDKYLHSFSIAYKVKKFYNKLIDNVKYRIIQDLNIANIAITGNPVNKNASFNVALKSFTKMEDNTKIQELETLNAELKSQVETLTSEKDSISSELAELKGTDYKKMYEELKAKYDKMMSDKKEDNTEMKSFSDKISNLETAMEELKKENAELKSFVEAPQLKSLVEGKSKEPNKEETKKVSMMDLL